MAGLPFPIHPHMFRRAPGCVSGGKLIVARLERDSLTTPHQCDLEVPAKCPFVVGALEASVLWVANGPGVSARCERHA
jgi:hypothetical protein